MPKYTYACSCGFSDQRYTKIGTKEIDCPGCGKSAKRQMPKLSGQVEVRETVDEFGRTWKKDQDKLVSDRKREYFWKHEVPKMVASGIYEMDTMLENGWVSFNDKGELIVHDKPPEAR